MMNHCLHLFYSQVEVSYRLRTVSNTDPKTKTDDLSVLFVPETALLGECGLRGHRIWW